MENNYPFVSIIIPVRNDEKVIGQCLDSLNKLNYPKDRFEIIVADSESDDRTAEIAKQYGAIYVSTPKRTISAGRNQGFKIAKGEIVAFSDADCVMDKDWIINSLKYFKEPMVAGAGGINITPDDESPFAKAVGFILDKALFSAGSIYARILKNPKEVKSIPGCNGIYRREALDKVMPINEDMLAEDYVMNQKIRQLGYKLMYTPDTVVWHYRRSTPKKFFRQMKHYAVCRLFIGRKLGMINLVHILIGLGLPIFLGLSLLLACLNPLWLICFLGLIILFLISYFIFAWYRLKSFKAASFVPYAILILFFGWSLGFLKELLFPTNENSNH